MNHNDKRDLGYIEEILALDLAEKDKVKVLAMRESLKTGMGRLKRGGLPAAKIDTLLRIKRHAVMLRLKQLAELKRSS